jgi:hypothetical protein
LKCGLYLLACFTGFLLLGGCAGTPGHVEAGLGQEFSLAIGQSAQIAGENLVIKFEEVVEDSRCPKDVVCVWAGRVSCAVEITYNGSPYRMVLVQPGLTDQHIGETYEKYQLTFNVEPYPEAGKAISKDEYRLLLTVSKN